MAKGLPIQVMPLGGLGEIGMNCLLVGHRGRWIMIDCGVQFPDPWDIGAERKLVDLDFLRGFGDRIEAVLVTHGHEDHIGALPWVLPLLAPEVPVYATGFTTQLIARRLREHHQWRQGRVTLFAPGVRFTAGPFEVEPIRVTHSLPDCCALALRCADGTLVHTGDWKIDEQPMDGDGFDFEAMERIGDEGVTLLLSDSTNALVGGWSASERTVADGILPIVEGHDGRVVVTQFASNLHRLRGLCEAAKATGRRIALVGRSLHTYLGCAAPVGRAPLAPSEAVSAEHLEDVPDGELLVVTTGSQGERNSVLVRASEGDHPQLRIGRGDLVLHSARVIPGNEARAFQMFNKLARRGATLVYGRRSGIHASGHAQGDELAELVRLLRPAHFVPIHGEYTFLVRHAARALEHGANAATVLSNGGRLDIGAGAHGVEVERRGRQPLKTWYNDGPATGDRDAMRLSERRRIAWNGVIVVDLRLRFGDGRAAADQVEVHTRAMWSDDGRLVADIEATARRVVGAWRAEPWDADDVAAAVRSEVERLCRRNLGKKPEVLVITSQAGASA